MAKKGVLQFSKGAQEEVLRELTPYVQYSVDKHLDRSLGDSSVYELKKRLITKPFQLIYTFGFEENVWKS